MHSLFHIKVNYYAELSVSLAYYQSLMQLNHPLKLSASNAISAQPVIHDATFDDIRLGWSFPVVVGRLLRFWDSGNIKKNGELMSNTLLLLDEKVTSTSTRHHYTSSDSYLTKAWVNAFHVLRQLERFKRKNLPQLEILIHTSPSQPTRKSWHLHQRKSKGSR
nr:PREDICTED: uncharacterized protein LOC108824505 [Raphanus sativus]